MKKGNLIPHYPAYLKFMAIALVFDKSLKCPSHHFPQTAQREMDLSALNSAMGRIHMMNERAVQSLSLFLSNKDK